jgi:hypothetical protein
MAPACFRRAIGFNVADAPWRAAMVAAALQRKNLPEGTALLGFRLR